MSLIYGDWAILIPLLSLLGLIVMLVAGIIRMYQNWKRKKYVEKIRNLKGGNN